KKVVDDLVEFGSVQRAFIGVSIRDIDSKLADERGLRETQGVYVAGLTPGGAAEEAGLREGDIITRVGDITVNNTPQLQEQIGRFRPGDRVSLSILREGKEQQLAVTLRNKDGDTRIVKAEESLNLLGASFEQASAEERGRLGLQGGVKVSKLYSGKLRSAGIKEGFIITSIDKKPVRNTQELDQLLKEKQGGILIEGVYPNGMKAYYGFGI
ncbi:MAG: PDZ domain-containing protein, partial [Bacteroidota bacterium]